MREDQNQVNQNENNNAYQYNPNRPQSSENNQEDHSDTKKVVDTAAKGAAQYFAPGVGGMAYDAAKKAPVVGDAIDKTTGKVAEVADQVPGVQQLTKGLNDTGITDAANKAIDLAGSKGASAGANAAKSAGDSLAGAGNVGNTVKGIGDASKRAGAIDEQAIPNMPIRKNTQFQNLLNQDDGEDLPEVSGGEGPSDSIENAEASSDTDYGTTPPPSDLPPDNIDDSNNNQDNQTKGEGDILGEGLKKVWNRYKIPIIISGAGVAFFLLIFIVIFGGGAAEYESTMGYYDALCNYNETKVTLLDCYQNSSDATELGTYDLADFVVNMTYLYTRDGKYSDEAIKALMIVLKTNALSYGGYNSSDKNVEVRVCDLYPEYEESDEENIFDGVDTESLTTLYNEISNYLYISSSYRSTISTMSRGNSLNMDESVLEEFNSLASEGNTYSQILNSVYNSSEEDNSDEEESESVYRETLFLGDSRTRGMQIAGVINDRNTIYGVGLGYNWLIGNGTFGSNTNSTTGGINGINGLMRDNASYNIVIWLGVNDLGNVESYYQRYYDLAVGDWREHNIYIVSVGPVLDDLAANVSNEMINAFNTRMQELINGSGLSNLIYIDLGLSEDDILSYDTSEGLHYGNEDYRNIYNIIVNNLDNTLSGNYQLYNLTSYCTYYSLTENTAYWWPVGSHDATEGNIYGGEPTSTVVTSNFGRRNTGIEGASTNHKGIDISKNGGSCGDIVIASRSGTVTKVTDDGGARGTYVIIDHGDGVETLYQHMQYGSYTVSVGDTVRQGQMIGLIGNTGVGSGCHLHFEVIVNDVPVDPLDYVDPENPRPVESHNLGDIGSGGTAEENKALVCNSLLNAGYSKNAVAGMMVNIDAEGGFRTNNLENCYEEDQCCKINGRDYGFCVHTEIRGFGSDEGYTAGVDSGAYARDLFVNDRAGYGLIQWTSSGRKAGLYDLAKEKNQSIASLNVQLEYLLQELQYDSYALTYKYITGNYSAYDIANTFCQNFESPANESTVCPARASANVDEYLEFVNNGCSY